jgi:hypothetical protein
MQMRAGAGVACPSSCRLGAWRSSNRDVKPATTVFRSRCVSTYPHNEALIVSFTCPSHQLALLPAPALVVNACSSIMAKPNITGFDPKAFAAAAKSGTKGDPWAR